MFAEIARVTRNGLIPFVAMGDYNEDYKELAANPWLAALGATIVLPPPGSVTCHQSDEGSPLDFGIASIGVAPLLHLEVIDEVPFGPHSAVKLWLPTSFRIGAFALSCSLASCPSHLRRLRSSIGLPAGLLLKWSLVVLPPPRQRQQPPAN